MADPTIFRLSSIDQSSTREYTRYALCYPCGSDNESIDAVATNLKASLKRSVSLIPIMAGTVVPIQANTAGNRRHSLADYPVREHTTTIPRRSTMAVDADPLNEQRGQLEVRVTLEDIEKFEPTFKTLGKDEFPHSYATLSKAGMPPMALIGDAFTPLPDTPAIGGSPALAVQGNFIAGGVVVAIYLHHSVAGVAGLAALVRCMSVSEEVLPGRFELTNDELHAEAQAQNALRDRLSGSRGYHGSFDEHPVYMPLEASFNRTLVLAGEPTCRALAFSLNMLDGTRDIANEHFLNIKGDPTARVSRFHCLIAILWKALTRARWPCGVATEGQTSALVVPINIRKCMEPVVDGSYYGNSDLFSYAKSTVCQLGLPFDVSTIGNTAFGVRRSFASLTEARVRSAIATINESEDVSSTTRPNIDFESDVFMTNWADLPVDENSTLGLGLGDAEWTRKLGRDCTTYDCVLLPLYRKGVWEVVLQLSEPEMERLLEDPGLAPFLSGCA